MCAVAACCLLIWWSCFFISRWCSGKKSTCQCRRHKKCGFDPWAEKSSWRRKWQPSPVSLPGKSHWQSSSVGCSPQSMVSRVRHDWAQACHYDFLYSKHKCIGFTCWRYLLSLCHQSLTFFIGQKFLIFESSAYSIVSEFCLQRSFHAFRSWR